MQLSDEALARCASTVPGQRARTGEHPRARDGLCEAAASSSPTWRCRAVRAAPAPAARRPPARLGDLPDALESLERERIRQALEACRYNKTKAAAQLGITFRALRYKLKKLEIE
jgi:DNA-binding NtrC family response regulator